MELTARKREILRRVVEEYVSTGQPVALEGRSSSGPASARPRPPSARSSPTSRRSVCSPTRTRSAGRIPTESGYRIYAEELVESIEGRPERMPLDLGSDAERARRGAAVDDGDALAGDASARARLGAVTRVRDRPPRRGARAPAARRDGRPDHDDGWRDKEVLRDRGSRRFGSRDLGEGVPERAGRRRPARHEHAPAPVRRPRQLSVRERAFLDQIRPAFVELLAEPGTQLYRRRRRRPPRRRPSRRGARGVPAAARAAGAARRR